MSKKISVDFFRVEMPSTTTETLHSVIRRVEGLPDDVSRNVELGHHVYRLRRAAFDKETCEGEMIRIRMDQAPLKANLAGHVEPIALADDEGMAEDTAFLYYRPTGVLLYQRNRVGVSPGRFAGYFETKAGLEGPIALDPLLEQNARKRMNKLNAIRKVEIRLTHVDRPDDLKDHEHDLNSVLDLLKVLDAPDARLTFSMGRSRGTLDVTDCLRTLNTLHRVAGSNEGNVTKLEVHGHRDVEVPEVIDLIKDRLVETFELEADAERRIPYETRRLALREALRRRMREVTAPLQDVG